MSFRRIGRLLPLLFVVLAPAIASADSATVTPVAKPLSVEASALQKETQLTPRFTTAQRAKVPSLGKDLVTRAFAPPAKGTVAKAPEEHAREVVTGSFAVLGSMNKQDIEAMAFLVLMAAAKSAQEDLKKVMASVKAINAVKACGGSEKCVAGLQPTAEMDLASLNSVRETWEQKRDSLADLSQEKQLQMQIYQERRSKLFSALSDMLKKFSDTANGITQNLK